jgi:hypothetical protein
VSKARQIDGRIHGELCASEGQSSFGNFTERTEGCLRARKCEEAVLADLSDQTGAVEVDALINDAVAVEEEHGDYRDPKRLAGGRLLVEFAGIGPQQIELGDDCVVVGHVDS